MYLLVTRHESGTHEAMAACHSNPQYAAVTSSRGGLAFVAPLVVFEPAVIVVVVVVVGLALIHVRCAVQI